jgi:16S rRNA (cytidine1402-2'-O)-methyltransferase
VNNLYIVDLWDGHWEDMTLRALRILRKATLIVIAGPKRMQACLERHNIHTPTFVISEQHISVGLDKILSALSKGDVAWVSGGVVEWTDSAQALFQALLERQIAPLPIPGPTPAIAGLAISGLPTDRFTFLGRLPPLTQDRRARLDQIARESHTLVCNLPAQYLIAALYDIQDILGDRVITIYCAPDIWRGHMPFSSLPQKGECTLIIQGAESDQVWTEKRVRDQVRAMLETSHSPRDIARDIAQRSGWPKRKVYDIAIHIDRSTSTD